MIDPLSILPGLLTQFWWAWLAILSLVLLGRAARSSAFRGWLGELRLKAELATLPATDYHVVSNMTLPTIDGGTRIDHVVVSRYGIVIIDTKDHGGWISGAQYERRWTRKLGRRSSHFQNPLRQNYKHMRTLAGLLELDRRALFPLVVFVGSAEFKTTPPEGVVKLDGCLDAIREHSAILLDEAEVARVLERIRSGRLAPAWRTQRAPAATLPLLPAPPRHAADCPRCGGRLDILSYKTGPKLGLSFQGCMRFPACTYRVELPAAGAALSATSSCST